MNTSVLNFVLLFGLGYFAYDVWNFYEDSSSPYLMAQAETSTLEATITEKNAKIEEAKVFFQTLEVKRAELRGLSEQLATMKSTLSEGLDLPQFMKSVLTEAKKVGLTVTGLTPQPQVKATYYVEQPFELTFQGVYVQLIAFMDRLSVVRNIVRVDDFSVKPKNASRQDSKYVEVEGTLRVKTYFYLGTAEDQLGKATPPGGAG